MMLIRHVIRDREPYSMNASATVQDAAEFMATRNVGAVCVVDDSGKTAGSDFRARRASPRGGHEARSKCGKGQRGHQ